MHFLDPESTKEETKFTGKPITDSHSEIPTDYIQTTKKENISYSPEKSKYSQLGLNEGLSP